MIVRGHERIHPGQIEAVLRTHPSVVEVAVVGKPDDELGETIAAFVRLDPNQLVTEKEIVAFARASLGARRTPTTWIFTDDLPHTASGMIRKTALLEQLRAQPS